MIFITKQLSWVCMRKYPNYRYWSSWLLLLLVLWTSRGQAMDQVRCSCPMRIDIGAIATTCCTTPSTSHATKTCHQVPQFKDCCCEAPPQAQALLPVLEQNLSATSAGCSALPPSPYTTPSLTRIVYWNLLVTPISRHYVPPLLYRDIPIFVQSFLL